MFYDFYSDRTSLLKIEYLIAGYLFVSLDYIVHAKNRPQGVFAQDRDVVLCLDLYHRRIVIGLVDKFLRSISLSLVMSFLETQLTGITFVALSCLYKIKKYWRDQLQHNYPN